ncbi:MAG TPA: hypothetical protein VMT61_02615 [Candidatus Binataceae bacterium]|nr:hypothetical protein [Candidatus Binataceae bacterium]
MKSELQSIANAIEAAVERDRMHNDPEAAHRDLKAIARRVRDLANASE